MLQWAVTFLIIALVAAVFGFSGIVVVSIELARITFGVFIILFLIAALMHALQGKPPPV